MVVIACGRGQEDGEERQSGVIAGCNAAQKTTKRKFEIESVILSQQI